MFIEIQKLEAVKMENFRRKYIFLINAVRVTACQQKIENQKRESRIFFNKSVKILCKNRNLDKNNLPVTVTTDDLGNWLSRNIGRKVGFVFGKFE